MILLFPCFKNWSDVSPKVEAKELSGVANVNQTKIRKFDLPRDYFRTPRDPPTPVLVPRTMKWGSYREPVKPLHGYGATAMRRFAVKCCEC
jgi:hypothetical protein